MRKKFVLFIAAIALCACDRNPFTPKSATLYCGDSFRVTTKGVSVESLQSTNNFVASVDVSGRVTAGHVGSAAITAYPYVLSDGTIAYDANNACEITVKPRHTYFTEPLMDWDISQEELVAKIGSAPDTTIIFDNESYSLSMPIFGDYYHGDSHGYIFVDNELRASNIVSRTASMEDAKNFMDERYEVTADYGEIIIYVNSYSNDATLFIGLQEGEDEVGHCVGIYYNPTPERISIFDSTFFYNAERLNRRI